MKEEPLKKDGVWQNTTRLLFSGYVFNCTSIKPELIADELVPIMDSMKGSHPFVRLLHYGDSRKSVAICERERNLLEQLLDENYCVVSSKGFVGNNGSMWSRKICGVVAQFSVTHVKPPNHVST